MEEIIFYDETGNPLTLHDSYEYCTEEGKFISADSPYHTGSGWFTYDFQAPVKISKYSVQRLNGQNDDYENISWGFYGSSEEGALEGSLDFWTTVDSRWGGDTWDGGEIREWEVTNRGKAMNCSHLFECLTKSQKKRNFCKLKKPQKT